MPEPIHAQLEADGEALATLRGKDYGDTIFRSWSRRSIDYEITPSIAVHGHAELNHKKELASLLGFTVQASGPIGNPIRQLKLDLVFETGDGKGKTDPSIAPRIVKILPGRQGYKIGYTKEKQIITVDDKSSCEAGARGGPFRVTLAGEQATRTETEREGEFYAFVRGASMPSDLDHTYNNSARWVFEGKNVKDTKDAGVPPVVDIAVLLMRSCDGPFLCKANVEIKVDWQYKAKDMVSSLLGWKTSIATPKVYDVTQDDQPEEEIDREKLGIFTEPEKMIDLVAVQMPAIYQKEERAHTDQQEHTEEQEHK